MLWNLMDHGHLEHWWQYVVVFICTLILLIGPAVLGVIYRTRHPRR